MKRAEPREIAHKLQGTPLIVMLDIDGTLCEIVEQPGDARVPDSVRASLRALLAAPARDVRLALVTGRSVADALRMTDITGITVYGNHGMERLSPSGDITGPGEWEQAGPALRAAARDLTILVAGFPGASLEDKGFTLTLHFRAMDAGLIPQLTSLAAEIARRYSLRIASGKCVVNMLPPAGFNKGDAVAEIVRDAGGYSPGAAILFAGDDLTDEDGFRALSEFPQAVTVRVGDGGAAGDTDAGSAARFWMDGPTQVHELLELLAEARS